MFEQPQARAGLFQVLVYLHLAVLVGARLVVPANEFGWFLAVAALAWELVVIWLMVGRSPLYRRLLLTGSAAVLLFAAAYDPDTSERTAAVIAVPASIYLLLAVPVLGTARIEGIAATWLPREQRRRARLRISIRQILMATAAVAAILGLRHVDLTRFGSPGRWFLFAPGPLLAAAAVYVGLSRGYLWWRLSLLILAVPATAAWVLYEATEWRRPNPFQGWDMLGFIIVLTVLTANTTAILAHMLLLRFAGYRLARALPERDEAAG